nr:hypothetical protein [Anaerolineae bacterium]
MGGELLKRISDFLARVPGLPIIVAVGLVALNFVLQLLPDWPVVVWLARTHLFLHIGLILGFLGVLLGEAL